jgi:hypothetical protein
LRTAYWGKYLYAREGKNRRRVKMLNVNDIVICLYQVGRNKAKLSLNRPEQALRAPGD